MMALSNAAAVEELRWKKFPVLNDGFVCLVDAMGDDAAVCQAARVSYNNDARDGDTTAGESDRTLIRYLMRQRHTSPLEMAEIKLLVRVPCDTWRQWIRHRTANVSEYSTRYTVAIDARQETLPHEWRLQATNNKQGSSGTLTEWPPGWSVENNADADPEVGHAGTCDLVYKGDGFGRRECKCGPPDMTPGEHLTWEEHSFHRHAEQVYQRRLQLGVAREQARKDLPLSTYTEAYWKIDLHNLLHFLSLRMDSHAQKEIRDYATTIGEQIVAKLFPEVWEAFKVYRLGAKSLTAYDVEVVRLLVASGSALPCPVPDYMSALWPDEWKGKPRCRERDECITKLQDLLLFAK